MPRGVLQLVIGMGSWILTHPKNNTAEQRNFRRLFKSKMKKKIVNILFKITYKYMSWLIKRYHKS